MSGLPWEHLCQIVHSFNRFWVISIHRRKNRGSRDPGHAPFFKFLGVVSGQSLGRLVSHLKSVALTVFELSAFIAEKFRGSRDPGHAPFWKHFGGRVRTVPGKTCVKFEVRSFNRFWAISINLTPVDRPLRTHTQTDRQTHIERTHYLRHSLRSLGADNKSQR